jgi:hypothetical protein
VPLAVFNCPSDPTCPGGITTVSASKEDGGKPVASCNYSYNTALFGAGGTHLRSARGRPSPYKIGNIPDGSSNTIGLVEQSGYYPAVSAQQNYEVITSWPYPAYPNTLGAYYPNPDQGAVELKTFPPPQIGVTPRQADPDTCQSYHTNAMVVSLMDGSVRNITSGVGPQTWAIVMNPADGLIPGSDW